MEFAYYSSKKFKIVCAYCGSGDDCTVDEHLKSELLCKECVSTGKLPITCGKFHGVKHASEGTSNREKRFKTTCLCFHLCFQSF